MKLECDFIYERFKIRAKNDRTKHNLRTRAVTRKKIKSHRDCSVKQQEQPKQQLR